MREARLRGSMMEGERDGVRSKMEAESNVGEVRWREKHDEGKGTMEGEALWREKCNGGRSTIK